MRVFLFLNMENFVFYKDREKIMRIETTEDVVQLIKIYHALFSPEVLCLRFCFHKKTVR